MYLISFENFNQLMEQQPSHEKHIRLLHERLYLDIAQRLDDFLCYSTKERYEKFVNTRPDIANRVNLGYIASYLGMQQETLSRIRALV